MRNTPTSLPSASFQSRTVVSALAESAHLPFAESATERTAASWPVQYLAGLAGFDVPDADRAVVAAGDEALAVRRRTRRKSPARCGLRTPATCLPDSRSHSRTVRSAAMMACVPSGATATALTYFIGPRQRFTSLPDCQVPEDDEAIEAAGDGLIVAGECDRGDQAEWPSSLWTCWPVSTSQRRAEPSMLPESARLPSADRATAQTDAV